MSANSGSCVRLSKTSLAIPIPSAARHLFHGSPVISVTNDDVIDPAEKCVTLSYAHPDTSNTKNNHFINKSPE